MTDTDLAAAVERLRAKHTHGDLLIGSETELALFVIVEKLLAANTGLRAEHSQLRESLGTAHRRAEEKESQLAAALANVERLNDLLRKTGYGQGQIDGYVAECEAHEETSRQLAAALARRTAMRDLDPLAVSADWEDGDDIARAVHRACIAALEAATPSAGEADDELPVDEAWLLSVGFEKTNQYVNTDETKMFVLRPISLQWYVYCKVDGEERRSFRLGARYDVELPTRSHVKRLCSALGIELPPATADTPEK